MGKYIVKKLLMAIPILLGITVVDFLIMSIAGSPLDMMVGPRVTRESLMLRAEQWGLDQPIYLQYIAWLRQVLHGNLGYSYKSYMSVSDLILSHLGPTLLLTVTSLIVGMLLSIVIGIYSAIHRYKKRDYALIGISFGFASIPGFFLALLLIYFLTVRLGILPSSGMSTPGIGGDLLDIIRHMVMPVIVLSVSILGNNVRYVRSAVLEILEADYLRTATSKGIGHFRVINKHALRNALLPIITIVGMEIPTLFGGSIIVEEIFSWPGLGLMTMNAIVSRDYPVIMGVSLLFGVVVLISNLITDILYALADPTIKY